MHMHSTRKQNTQNTKPPDIQTALLDFARLSQRANQANSHLTEATAAMLLEQIIRLCAAQRGAIVLANSIDVSPVKKATSLRELVLASDGIGENEIHTLLAMAQSVEQEYVMDEYCWYRADLPLKEIQEQQPVVAVVLLGWPSTTHISHETTTGDTIAKQQEPDPNGTMQHAQETITGETITGETQSIVLLVEDAVKAVIPTILLTESVQGLENITYVETINETEQLKSDLLSTMSHELRSPLTSIKGYTATLLRYDKRLRHEEQRAFLEAIRDASDNLSVIVDRLLEMAEFEADTTQLHLSSVDMPHLAKEAIGATEHSRHYMQVTAAHPGLFTLRVNTTDKQGLPTDTVPLVWGDQRRLREVLDNMLENALKFSPDGGEITITLRPVTSPPPEPARSQNGETPALPLPMLEIKIQDHGIGIADEHLLRIFDRFQRVDTRLTREVNGLGLGLAICKYIVARQHGYLWAESQPGKGSTFYIWLPLAQTETTES